MRLGKVVSSPDWPYVRLFGHWSGDFNELSEERWCPRCSESGVKNGRIIWNRDSEPKDDLYPICVDDEKSPYVDSMDPISCIKSVLAFGAPSKGTGYSIFSWVSVYKFGRAIQLVTWTMYSDIDITPTLCILIFPHSAYLRGGCIRTLKGYWSIP